MEKGLGRNLGFLDLNSKKKNEVLVIPLATGIESRGIPVKGEKKTGPKYSK